jgi:hypothetical protein
MGEVVELSRDSERIAQLEGMLELAMRCGKACEDARRARRVGSASRALRDRLDRANSALHSSRLLA